MKLCYNTVVSHSGINCLEHDMGDFANEVAGFLLDAQGGRSGDSRYNQAFAGIQGTCAGAGFDLDTALSQARGADPDGQKRARLAAALRGAMSSTPYFEEGIRDVLKYYGILGTQTPSKPRYISAGGAVDSRAASSDSGMDPMIVAVLVIGVLLILAFCVCGMG